MIYLSELRLAPRFNVSFPTLTPDGFAAPTEYNFLAYIRALEQFMYEQGWTMIGSCFKLPNLHPWKAPTREQLHHWAQQNLQPHYQSASKTRSKQANSLTIRLADTETIALDCDFHSSELMHAFVEQLHDYLLLRHDQFYTCSGKKGCKLFFRYHKESDERLPLKLGVTAYNAGFGYNPDYKQELELKSNLSTVAGLYGQLDGREVVYGPYEDYPYICATRPMDLPELTSEQLQGIAWRYNNLLYSFGMVESNNCLIQTQPQYLRTHEALCSVVFLRYLLSGAGKSVDLAAILRSIEQGEDFDLLFAWLNFAGQCQAYRIISSLYVVHEVPEQLLWVQFKRKLLSMPTSDAWSLLLSSSNRLFAKMLPEVLSLRYRIASLDLAPELLEALPWVWHYAPLPVLTLNPHVHGSVEERIMLFAQAVQQPHLTV